MGHLKLRFLGPPDVQHDGQPLSFSTRKTLALLVYLVVEGADGIPMQPREKLAVLFWPESDSSRGRAALRNTLRYLRDALPADDAGDTLHLIIERNALGFDFDSDYSLDLEAVESAVGAQDTVPLLQEAVDAYRGDFLEGFSLGDASEFDDWASFQRELWHRRLDTIFDRLSQHQLDRGEATRAAETATRWTNHDPVNEIAYRRLMHTQFVGGDRAAALRTFEACENVLAEELGVEPAPKTRALAARLRRGTREVATAAQFAGETTGTTRSPLQDLPLVGRATEFSVLVEHYHTAIHGITQAAIIVGEAGMGKSRLLEEFLRWAAAQEADVLQGRGFESGTHLPYQTLVEPFRTRLDRANAPDTAPGDLLSDTWLAELSRLLPELRDRYPDLEMPAYDDATARSRLLEAIARLVQALAERSPLVLAIDDAQWADGPSREALHYICRRCADVGAPVFLVAAVRKEALDPLTAAQDPEIIDWLRDLERAVPVTSITLQALTQDETAEFLQALEIEGWDLGSGEQQTAEAIFPNPQSSIPQSRPFTQWLYSETGGHPFYLVETLKDLRERGCLREHRDSEGNLHLDVVAIPGEEAASGQATSVPERVRRVIAARLNRLSVPAFALLAASAVLGHGLTFEMLCEVAGLDEDAGLSALDELLRAQLLREVDDADGPYIFAHDKIRDVVYTDAGDARRRIFHRRALSALVDEEAPPGELAYHALAAGEMEAACRHSIAAGDAALEVFAAREAIRQYERARDVHAETTQTAPGDLQHLYLQLGRAYELAGDYDQALTTYGDLEEIARRREDKELQLAALMARTTVYAAPTQHYDPEQVDVLTQRALPLARELDDHAAEARIRWNLMLLNLFTGDTRQAIEDGEASLQIAREHNLREQKAYSLHDLHRAYLATGQAEEGLIRLREARELWRELGNTAMLADGLVIEAAYLGLAGELDRSLEFCQEALDLSRSIDNLWNQSFSQFTMTPIYFERGEYGKAIEVGTASVELGEQAGFMVPTVGVEPLLAWIYALCGDLERAFAAAERAIQRAEQMHESLLAGPMATVAFLHTRAGDLEAADKAIRAAQEHFNPEANDFGGLMLPIAAPRVALARGEPERALTFTNEIVPLMRRQGVGAFIEDAMYLQGRALRALGRIDEARDRLEEARRVADDLEARRVLWLILMELADIVAEQGDTEAAGALRQDARDIVEYIAGQIHESTLADSYRHTPAIGDLLEADSI